MKLQRFIILLIVLLIFIACPMDYYHDFRFENNSAHDVYIYLQGTGGTLYPDTAIAKIKSGIPFKKGESRFYDYSHSKEDTWIDTLCLFVFDADTFNTYSWEEIQDGYKILQRYDISPENLNALKRNIPYPPDERMKNIRMFRRMESRKQGMFTDKNRNFWARTWQFASRFSWEALQTTVGVFYTQGRNIGGQVDRVDYLGGATFATKENSSKHMGVTIGNYINMNIGEEITGDFDIYATTIDPMFMHEYGHTFDSRIFGISYLFAVGIPSIISASKSQPVPNGTPGLSTHDSFWTERRANRRAKRYFRKYYNVDWNAVYGTYSVWDDELQMNIWKPYTIEDIYPTY